MFNRDYLEKLKQYVGKDIQLVESDNEVNCPLCQGHFELV